jgi:hypothetical protein
VELKRDAEKNKWRAITGAKGAAESFPPKVTRVTENSNSRKKKEKKRETDKCSAFASID